MLLGRELRSRGHRNRIGFFLHTPCAPPDILQTLPQHKEILGGLTYYNLVGFQTEKDRDNFARYLIFEGAVQVRGSAFEMEGRKMRLRAFPVSIETKAYMRLARNAGHSALVALVRESLGGSRLVLGVDRLDYSMGIPQRVKAFEQLLETSPEWHGKVTLLQITPKSRTEVEQYGEIEAGHVPHRQGQRPIWRCRLDADPLRQPFLFAHGSGGYLSRRRRRDGDAAGRDEFVAKEYLAAQDPEDPGVLVLSQFAGAAKELDRALIVNPHETEAVVSALKRALAMPLAERRERHGPMLTHLLENDIRKWAETIWPPGRGRCRAQPARRHPRVFRRIVRPSALRDR